MGGLEQLMSETLLPMITRRIVDYVSCEFVVEKIQKSQKAHGRFRRSVPGNESPPTFDGCIQKIKLTSVPFEGNIPENAVVKYLSVNFDGP